MGHLPCNINLPGLSRWRCRSSSRLSRPRSRTTQLAVARRGGLPGSADVLHQRVIPTLLPALAEFECERAIDAARPCLVHGRVGHVAPQAHQRQRSAPAGAEVSPRSCDLQPEEFRDPRADHRLFEARAVEATFPHTRAGTTIRQHTLRWTEGAGMHEWSNRSRRHQGERPCESAHVRGAPSRTWIRSAGRG